MEALRPTVSVLLPVRQWGEFTLTAINSILQQTLRSFELLIIGQNKLDELRCMVPNDPRINIIARQAPGIVGALNTGIQRARGHYIARMDDDDIAYPDRLQVQLDHLLSRPHRQLCATRIRFVDSSGSPAGIAEGNRRYEAWLNSLVNPAELKLSCYRECPMPHPTLMAHHSFWREIGGYRQRDVPEDHDLVLRAMLAGYSLSKPAAVLQDWRNHQNRLTYTDQRYRRAAFVKAAAWAISQPASAHGLNTGRSVWLCGTGKLARHWHDALCSNHVSVSGFVDVARLGPKRTKRLLPVISYDALADTRKNALIITAITQPAGRHRLCQFLQSLGCINGRDYLIGG